MQRVNTFDVVPQTDADEELLRRLLDASASLWNEVNYERRRNREDPDKDVFDTSEYRGRYGDVLGASTVQQIERKNAEAWRSYFTLKKKDERARPPGFRGNRDEGRELRTYIRNTSYSIQWGERSRLDILVGSRLKQEYGLGAQERLRLEIRGKPKWSGKQGRLELYHDESSARFRAIQPVRDCSPQASPLADETAALDIGANNLVACTTTTGKRYLYEGRDLFGRFAETTERIAEYQSLLDEGRYSSNRIRRLYRKRTKRRNHAQDALVRDLIERLHEQGVSKVYVGALTDVLETSWSVTANQKTHNFWAFRQFVNRLACVCEEFGMELEADGEEWTSQECPHCGERDETVRHKDTLTCPCGFDGHADLTASRTFLHRQLDDSQVGLMAQPVRLKWNGHKWSESPYSCSNEVRTNPQVAFVGESA